MMSNMPRVDSCNVTMGHITFDFSKDQTCTLDPQYGLQWFASKNNAALVPIYPIPGPGTIYFRPRGSTAQVNYSTWGQWPYRTSIASQVLLRHVSSGVMPWIIE